ncbi:MAG: hypothetical protein EBY29_08635 [Planctomycetes bacterium]|nr:hypothetical protein [Planctomycetota bacterium]
MRLRFGIRASHTSQGLIAPAFGAQRDTIEVPPYSIIKIAFDADNPGIWPFHCHIPYHADSGMCTMLKYEGVETPHWHPEEVPSEKLGL